MAQQIGTDEIEALWRRFSQKAPGDEEIVTADGFRRVMAALGHDPESKHVDHAGDGLAHDQFVATIASLHGDMRSRLAVAFDVFDENGDGRITLDELRDVLTGFGLSDAELQRLFAEGDLDGEGAIDFEEFCALMPEAHELHAHAYRDTHFAFAGSRPSDAAVAKTTPEKAGAAPPRDDRAEPGHGTSRLQMQIGLFRLLQAAAYRSFRENCAANYHTHLRARKMPYTITHFVDFADRAIALYKALGIVESACFPVLDAVNESLRRELGRLQDRIANWATVDKTPQMLATADAMAADRSHAATARRVFAAGVECALTLRKNNLTPADMAAGRLELHELKRLQTLDLHEAAPPMPAVSGPPPTNYLESWNRVILESEDEEVDGAMMPSAYWYEDFMPKLLAACSVGTADEIGANTVPDEAELDRWFAAAAAAGEFHPFGEAVATHFAQCRPTQKLKIRQAWRLIRHYLNGVQKRRERLEFGRETGFLSQYVAFLDVYLGRSDVRDAQMRVSFPYFIGPATWRFLHTSAEIICGRGEEEQKSLIGLFKDFFRLFATMYPCPYCRYHLNRYVVQNREVDMYPLEFLLLGCDPGRHGFEVSIDEKLESITDGNALRLFLWKLHNAVSSSIARTESWFHRDDHVVYTSRHWPSLSEELARARAFGQDSVSVDRLLSFCALLTPVGRLAALRGRWLGMHADGRSADVDGLVEEAQAEIRDLQAALAAGTFLERAYRFDPALEDHAPHFTPEEEAFGRSGLFVEA